MEVVTEETKTEDLYKLLIGCVVPRPIAWVSTVSTEGILNLAPFSFFNAFSVNPPILGIGIGAKRSKDADGNSVIVPKDTYMNIAATKEFVVNVVSLPLAEKMNQTSANYESSQSEFEHGRLTAEPSTKVKPPRVKECSISMECSLYQTIELGNTNLVLGKILVIHCDDQVIESGLVNMEALQAVGRLSGTSYCPVQAIFDIPRPVL